MKLLVLIGCAFAAVSADYHQPYYGPQHNPVIQNGVPVEPPEVQKARASHLAAFGGAPQYPAAPQYNAPAPQYNAPAPYNQGPYNAPSQPVRYTPPAYQTSHVTPAIGNNGVPLDTPEVNAAKASHFAAYSQQHAALGQALSQAQPAGHGGYGGQGHYRKRRSIYGGYGGGYAQHVPAIGPNGVPLDTPEVQHAKAAHFAAVAEASARAGGAAAAASGGAYDDGSYRGGYDDGSYDGRYDDGSYDGRYDGAYDGRYDGAYNGAYNGGYNGGYGYAGGWSGPIHIPVINANGVPVEPAAVQQARAAHLAAVGDAAARSGAGHIGYGHTAPWGAHY
ncbi:hypothetical protein AMK59_6451 [Oryctes borbonicus]|uniref:Uncharacterized protein n=1 Tax=Oryctes borbonicus TaxID=1629725 RepID=A0A0T6AZV7_9SCAR|nr:hypothetical protein AMK59_6451 [Oryctes borbonicus]